MELVDSFSICLMVFETIFILWLLVDKKHLSPFAARKLCHAGSGLIMMMLNCDVTLPRFFIYAVVIISLSMNWQVFPSLLPNFWFGEPKDIGITLYLIIVAGWVYVKLPLRILAPVFTADPAGAVVGKWVSANYPHLNRKWCGEKTIAGSLAVFVMTYYTLWRPLDVSSRLGVALLAMVGEAIGGAFDNLVIALVVIAFSYHSMVAVSPGGS